ncbi:cobalt/nickel transport system permease protein [Thermovibrio guaymasensis]|uniref:Cobalt/nickel transport system permease protein n=1 Tax=Thermovibrio guaymasensis TaxID=240167 RepID=A0A420W5R4_9BACT|nr:cobalt transporter CbiM [Thermovibrio guaymasensis]RKQ60341.1 cobalt/nickel transport system permease protein [Thermovibrio guaymasensis]
MHISEGVLPGWLLSAGWVATTLGLWIGMKKTNQERLPFVALLSSVFFVASLIHVPVGITSVHLLLNGLIGICLGWSAYPAIFVGLLFQALLFQFGGITVLGVNTFNMASGALTAYYLTKPLLKRPTKLKLIGAGTLGALSVVLTSGLLLSLELLSCGNSFRSTATLAFLAHLPVASVEAVINSFSLVFLLKNAPELLEVK